MNLETRVRFALSNIDYKIQVAEQNAKLLATNGNYKSAAEEQQKAANLVSGYVHLAYWLPEFVPEWMKEKYKLPERKTPE